MRVADDLHAVVATRSGGLAHALRRPDCRWVRFRDVKAHAGNPGTVADVASTAVEDCPRPLMRTTGGLVRADRRADWTWTDVDMRDEPGPVARAAIT